jgi:hypothetical protein
MYGDFKADLECGLLEHAAATGAGMGKGLIGPIQSLCAFFTI